MSTGGNNAVSFSARDPFSWSNHPMYPQGQATSNPAALREWCKFVLGELKKLFTVESMRDAERELSIAEKDLTIAEKQLTIAELTNDKQEATDKLGKAVAELAQRLLVEYPPLVRKFIPIGDQQEKPEATRVSAPSGGGKKLTAEEINKLPLASFTGGEIRLVRTVNEAEAAVSEILRLAAQNGNVIGIDTETRPAFRKGERYSPSLLQVCPCDNIVWIFFLQSEGILGDGSRRSQNEAPQSSALPPSWLERLMGGGALKSCFNWVDDVIGLRRLQPKLNPPASGFVDPARFARSFPECGVGGAGLRALAAELFGLCISKQQQLTNWAAPNLTEAQLRYAATDACISRMVLQKFCELLAGNVGGDCAAAKRRLAGLGGRSCADCQATSYVRGYVRDAAGRDVATGEWYCDRCRDAKQAQQQQQRLHQQQRRKELEAAQAEPAARAGAKRPRDE